MAVQERDYMKGGSASALPGQANWLDRLNELGERHATAIIAVSTGLIILTVLIFAKYFYDKTQVERAEQELSTAEAVDQLAGLKTKYGSTPVAPRILFRLANKYYEDGKLELFNLANDPYEKNDLAAKESARVKALHAKLKAWRACGAKV